MFTGIGSAVTGVLGSLASSALSSYLNEQSANRAAEGSLSRSKELAQWQAEKLPAMQVQGLRAAGINPLLAYSNLGSAASMPLMHAAAPQHDYSNVGKALSELPERASALRTEAAHRQLLRAQADESRSRAENARLHNLIDLENLQAGVSLRAAQEAYFRSQIPKQGGHSELSVGLPFGMFSFKTQIPIGDLRSSRSVQSAREHIQDIRGLSPVDTGLDHLWLPVVEPVKSAPKYGPRSGYKRPGSLGH